MKNILLLNPPGKKLYIRDYFCSKVSQANYISHPIDLVIISGILSKENFSIHLIDSIVEKLTSEKTIEKISKLKPDFVISLSGAVSWEEDKEFFRELKKTLDTKLILCGDIFLENTEKYLEDYSFIDGIVLDFTSKNIIDYVKGKTSKREIIKDETNQIEFEIPVPRHGIFLELSYRYPFTLSRKYCSVLTEYGCPFKCSFCIMGKLKYKYRKPENVISELKYIDSLGVKEIFFVDQTFGANRKKTVEILSEMVKNKFNFKWFGFSRVDVLDTELLELMRKSGCHTLILGIESGSDEILSKYRKGYNKKQIEETLNTCSKLGIRTVGTFIFGLPDETQDTADETINFLKKLPLDYASFNVAVPRAGTDLRKQAILEKLIDEKFEIMDQSGTEIAMSTKYLNQEDVKKLRQRAVKEFYLRPKYLIKRLFKIRTFYELLQNIENAIQLIKNTWTN